MFFSRSFAELMYLKAFAFAFLLVLAAVSMSCGDGSSSRPFTTVRTIGTSNDQLGEPFGIAVKGDEVYVSDGERGSIAIGNADRILEPGRFRKGDFGTPSGMALSKDGDVLFVDATTHSVIKLDRSITPMAGLYNQTPGLVDGPVTVAKFNGPTGIAIDGNGRIFVSDTYNDRIRVIENGFVSTFAGSSRGFADGMGASAQFDTPLGLAMWGERLLVADAGNRRIRVVEPDGRVWTLAGNGGGDLVDGFPLQASFVRPTAIAVSPDGAIYVADGNAIRVIGRRSFAFVETLAGGTGRGFRDGNPLTAQFNRPSGLAFDAEGRLLVADSDNGLIRVFDFEEPTAKTESPKPKTFTAEQFRALQPPRWPYDPPEAKRDIAGTLGEIRGEIVDASSQVWFHNGLDIAGGYGETARFIRDEKVLNPMSAENFGNLRELLRMQTIGYIHIRLGRDKDDRSFNDPRFLFSRDPSGKLNDVRVPRGASFKAGEPIGTLNAMNHVHMIAGPSGAEMNALAALTLPNVSDSIAPTIQETSVFDENWNEIETQAPASRIRLTGKTRIVVRAFDRMDGNPERRRLGVYRVGYQILNSDNSPRADINWSITFDRNPPWEAVKTVYAIGSKSGATGETIFNYIATNRLSASGYGERFFDPATLEAGTYTIRVYAADFLGNQTYKDIPIEVTR
jgi:sugar lactone lactonase YvrE